MVGYVMTMILDEGRNMKWMMTLNLCLIALKEMLEINHTYGSLRQPMLKNILWRVTILFIYHIMGERGRLFKAKGR